MTGRALANPQKPHHHPNAVGATAYRPEAIAADLRDIVVDSQARSGGFGGSDAEGGASARSASSAARPRSGVPDRQAVPAARRGYETFAGLAG